MRIYKPLTDKEINHNKRNKDKKPVEPHTGFFICETKFPVESSIWNKLGFNILQAAFKDLNRNSNEKENHPCKPIEHSPQSEA